MMPTKTRPLARFGYLAFAPFSFSPAIVESSPAIPNPIGHASPTASDLVLKIAVQV